MKPKIKKKSLVAIKRKKNETEKPRQTNKTKQKRNKVETSCYTIVVNLQSQPQKKY
jgi:hypothetical protein